MSNISVDELKMKFAEKKLNITDEELSTIIKTIEELNFEKAEDGLFTLISVRWRTDKNRFVKISIPW